MRVVHTLSLLIALTLLPGLGYMCTTHGKRVDEVKQTHEKEEKEKNDDDVDDDDDMKIAP